MYAESFNLDLQQELTAAKEEVDRLNVRNTELESMVMTRNNAIDELSKRVKVAEELVLSDPDSAIQSKYLFAGNVITLGGVSYSMEHFPANFIVKAKNVIANSAGRITPL